MDANYKKSLVISAVLLIISIFFISGTLKIAQKSERLIQANKELMALKQEKERLEAEAEYRLSPEFVEKEARNKLNLVKPGEEVYFRPKIMGDDLLGTQNSGSDALHGGGAGKPERDTGLLGSFFAPVTTKIDSLFDKIKDLLVLFQD